jgi:hypothetical protein
MDEDSSSLELELLLLAFCKEKETVIMKKCK